MEVEVSTLISLGTIIFSIGGAWAMIRNLKERVAQLEKHKPKMWEFVNSTNTKIAVIEEKVKSLDRMEEKIDKLTDSVHNIEKNGHK